MKKILTLTTKCLLLALGLFIGQYVQAQVTVGSGDAANNFSVLEISTKNVQGGLRLPRLTTQEIKELEIELTKSAGQSQGLMVYNLNTNCIQTWTGTLGKWLVYCGLNEEALTGISIQTVQNVLWWNGDDSPGQETQTRLEVVYSPTSTTERGVEWRIVGAPDIISISSYGEVKALKDGKVQVFAVSIVDNSIQSNTLEITVRTKLFGLVADAPVKQLWTNGTGSANEEKSVQAILEYKTSASRSYKNVAWKSSNTAVATVNVTGLITAVGNGAAYIYAESTDQPGTTSNNISITVGTKLRGFNFSKAATALQLGAIATDVITVSLNPLNSTDYTDFDAVICSDNNVASCVKNSNQITITAKAAGSCNLKVTKQCSDRLVQSATYPITVALPVGAIGTLNCGNNTINVVNGQAVPSNTFTVSYSGKTGDIIVLANNQALGTAVNGLTVVADGAQTLGLGATGSVKVKVIGTPWASGNFNVPYTVGGKSCNILAVLPPSFSPAYNVNSGTTTLNVTGAFTGGTGDAKTRSVGVAHGAMASGVFRYTGGSGQVFPGATATANGITVTVPAATLANGSGELAINVSGTPSAAAAGKAFDIPISIYGQQLYVRVSVGCGAYTSAARTVPSTGGDPAWKQFQCFNLGANTNLNPFTYVVGDAAGENGTLGWLFQWGRRADGHQRRNSPQMYGVTATNTPNNSYFYYGKNNWLNTFVNSLWGNGSATENMPKGPNDPCPTGWKVPSQLQWQSIYGPGNSQLAPNSASANSWSWTGNGYAVGSALALPASGKRPGYDPTLYNIGTEGSYWTSTTDGQYGKFFSIEDDGIWTWSARSMRDTGMSVRCISE